jgi:hypothetical protein
MRFLKIFALATAVLVLGAGIASSQTWTPLAHQPPNQPTLGPMLQLRDGRILVHEEQNGNPRNWWILTPDSTGSYVNGQWSSGGQLPENYSPFYFGSQVLSDGARVVIEGGEYNFGTADWTTLGAIGTVSGSTFTWTGNLPPTGWGTIGDAESTVLADGSYMQANCCTAQNAIFVSPNVWAATGSVKQPNNDESGFTLLTNDKVLTVDAKHNSACSTSSGSELYSGGVWSCGPNTTVQLYNPGDEELGAAVMMYNNKVMQFGGNVVATNVYDVTANTWAAGPTPAGGLDQADGPASLEPNGKVLAMLSPGLFASGCQFVEYDPVANSLSNTANPTNCPADSSFVGHLMILPTGQIMFTDLSNLVEIYTPVASLASGAKRPLIVAPKVKTTMTPTNNSLTGYYFNGLTENNGYGDDYQGRTDYPLVRLTSSTGSVFYGTTHSESTHSISPTAGLMSTMFDEPTITILPSGCYKTEVVANGITSSNSVVFCKP